MFLQCLLNGGALDGQRMEVRADVGVGVVHLSRDHADVEDILHDAQRMAEAARGMRLNIASGTAVRFEPGQQRTVELVDYAGERTVYGFRGLIQGALHGDH